MKQLQVFIGRLSKPSVIISIASQIITILILLKVNVDKELILGVVTTCCSILVTLGILSNPTSDKKDFLDDIYFCPNCQKESVHVMINDKMVCSECGEINEKTSK